MSKETKEKTAIRVLKEAFIELGYEDLPQNCWFQYLEEAVDKAQKYDDLCEELSKLDGMNSLIRLTEENIKLNQENYKLKKAIEILKDKVGFIFHIDDDNKYYFSSKYLCNEITKEEYELLKEVLEE